MFVSSSVFHGRKSLNSFKIKYIFIYSFFLTLENFSSHKISQIWFWMIFKIVKNSDKFEWAQLGETLLRRLTIIAAQSKTLKIHKAWLIHLIFSHALLEQLIFRYFLNNDRNTRTHKLINYQYIKQNFLLLFNPA